MSLGLTACRCCVRQDAIDSVSATTHCLKKHSSDCYAFLGAEFNLPALCLRQFCSIDAGGTRRSRLRPACHSPYFPEFLHCLILAATTLSHSEVCELKSKMVGQKVAGHFCQQRSRRDYYDWLRETWKKPRKLRRLAFCFCLWKLHNDCSRCFVYPWSPVACFSRTRSSSQCFLPVHRLTNSTRATVCSDSLVVFLSGRRFVVDDSPTEGEATTEARRPSAWRSKPLAYSSNSRMGGGARMGCSRRPISTGCPKRRAIRRTLSALRLRFFLASEIGTSEDPLFPSNRGSCGIACAFARVSE